ncbi:hypothetical protein [Rhizorhabdus sp.]|uniref:hypothetical protein n=1 Tax=Rhizorhabdus sp. TaxID=1968843 RepID=UPI00199F8829|nr:hypothetical protein [Rhizorhabdus sp.]MBD3759500.1 hypothetical protein [Rhizorhabdus sp.]
MATKTTTSRPRSTATRTASRKRSTSTATRKPRAQALTEEAKTAVRSVRTRAAKKVPTDATSLSIAAGVLAGFVAAGIAIFMNRDRLRSAASTGGERLRKAADDLSSMAHDRIDQARDNITKFRARSNDTAPSADTSDSMAING